MSALCELESERLPRGHKVEYQGSQTGPGATYGVQSVFWPWILDGFLDAGGGGPQLRKTRVVTLVSVKHSAIPSRKTRTHVITMPLLCIAITIAHISTFVDLDLPWI